ncbi:MAG: heme exporter protein CcmB [Candidatus Bathyarchaeia archaeon]
MGFFSASLRIAEKDLKAEFRRTYEILSILTFSVSAILICSFAWGGAIVTDSEVASAALWIILFFASVLTFTTSFAREMDRGTLGGLKTLPCSSLSILFGKVLYATVLLLLVEGVLLPFSVVFLNLKISGKFLDFLLIFILGMVDLSFAGSFVSGLVMFSEGKTLLLSFLLFPVCMPVLISSVLATDKIIGGVGVVDVMPELKLLLAFLLCIIAVAGLTFKFVLEE